MNCDVGEVTERCSFSNLSVACAGCGNSLITPVANSPIHHVYRRYTNFRWTQNIDEMCFLAILCGECMGLRAHFYTARNSDIHAPIVLPWFFTSKASGDCSLKQSSGQAPLNTVVNCRS